MPIVLKRIYDEDKPTGDYRILIDRVWPRGISKEQAYLNDWMKELTPNASLRKWFNHVPEKFAEFAERYIKELQKSESATEKKRELQEKAQHQQVVLLYGAKDKEHNHAVILKEWLENS
ncbi:Uncharacterized conserved protein YeaO, DUF488 family [Halobacillus dabanensis]|uniref:Uncharacterized conserved protein YeaO, DUF488 family n=1 Tax=Halobacillus dabanensis TaxID=240302 RepID=A0A1I3WM42_HALDA|nr:DUF488 family protein [Halobacillus dabanensis]SFK08249.1 Uncharacterized conserved protein YeaO, DUF488 family [Halobacillus dabanensis]